MAFFLHSRLNLWKCWFLKWTTFFPILKIIAKQLSLLEWKRSKSLTKRWQIVLRIICHSHQNSRKEHCFNLILKKPEVPVLPLAKENGNTCSTIVIWQLKKKEWDTFSLFRVNIWLGVSCKIYYLLSQETVTDIFSVEDCYGSSRNYIVPSLFSNIESWVKCLNAMEDIFFLSELSWKISGRILTTRILH